VVVRLAGGDDEAAAALQLPAASLQVINGKIGYYSSCSFSLPTQNFQNQN